MRISEIRTKKRYQISLMHGDYTVWIVGTGPSMRFFPMSILKDKVTIGLNQAWRYFSDVGPTFSITVHPELYQAYADTRIDMGSEWLVKIKSPMENLTLDNPHCYAFHTTPEWSAFWERPADTLFIGRGIQQTAMDLSARLGAKRIILVGVDMCSLEGDHHAHNQHTQFHGLAPNAVYSEYREWTRTARTILHNRFDIEVLTMSPFLGANSGEEDYAYMCRERGFKPLPKPDDVSRYKREKTDTPALPK